LDGPDLVLTVGGQCDGHSYLRLLRVFRTDGGRVLSPAVWEIWSERADRRVETVTVGRVPEGFAERTNELPAQRLAGTVSVTLTTNFMYSAQVDLAALADGRTARYRPAPVMNENAPVAPARC
jgi:hypothetical protein